MTQVLDLNAIDFANDGAIGVIVSFGDSIWKGRRNDDHDLFAFEGRFIVAAGDQRTRPVTQRYGFLVAEPLQIVLGGLRKHQWPENEISRVLVKQVGNNQLALWPNRKLDPYFTAISKHDQWNDSVLGEFLYKIKC